MIEPPNTVNVLGLFFDELPLALMTAFRYYNGLLRLSASNSAGDRATTKSVKGFVKFLVASTFELVLVYSGIG